MPAPVPPGYTRGPLVWLGAPGEHAQVEALHQWLWREAGGYGARVVLITTEAAHVASVAALHDKWVAWESDHVAQIVALNRQAARNPAHDAPVAQATAIVLMGDDPMRWAATIGGTPLAQAIRRANARSKLVAGMGAVGAFLSQHIISPGPDGTTLRGAVTFGPGLGLVNRVVTDATASAGTDAGRRRLYAAVVANPFLIGVGLPAGSAAILYPDNTLNASGPNPLTVLDGHALEAADTLYIDAAPVEPLKLDAVEMDALVGAHHVTLHPGDGFNLDDHTLRPKGEVDLPTTGPVTSVF